MYSVLGGDGSGELRTWAVEASVSRVLLGQDHMNMASWLDLHVYWSKTTVASNSNT